MLNLNPFTQFSKIITPALPYFKDASKTVVEAFFPRVKSEQFFTKLEITEPENPFELTKFELERRSITTIDEVFVPQPVEAALSPTNSEAATHENPLALMEAQQAPAPGHWKGSNFPAELLHQIFSHLNGDKGFLYLSKTLRDYFLTCGKLAVAFNSNFFNHLQGGPIDFTKELVNLMQKTYFKFQIDAEQLEYVKNLMAISPAIFGDEQNPTKKVIELAVSYERYDVSIDWKKLLNWVNDYKFLQILSFGDVHAYAENIFPEGLTALQSLSFGNISGDKNITIPEGLTALRSLSFGDVDEITYIRLSGVLTALQSLSFGNIHRATHITIPERLTALQSLSFGNINSYCNITISGGLTALQSLSFDYISPFATITIPEGLTALKSLSFRKVDFCAIITIPPDLILDENLSKGGRLVYKRV